MARLAGQHEKVVIRHLIADGSIDSAISLLHEDKQRLSSAVLDGDFSSFEQDADGNAVLTWKKTGRVVDAATTINEQGVFRTNEEDEVYIATLLRPSHVKQRDELEKAALREKAIENEMMNIGERERTKEAAQSDPSVTPVVSSASTTPSASTAKASESSSMQADYDSSDEWPMPAPPCKKAKTTVAK
jgi:hypothetical protein